MTSWISSIPDTVFHDVCSASTPSRRVASLPTQPTLIIVPTSRQRDDVLMQWARCHGRGEPPLVLTMAGLYRALAPCVMQQVPRILPDSSVDVLLQHAMDTCQLPTGSVKLRASRVVRWAQELRSPAWLRDVASRHPSNRSARQLVTAAVIWEAYEELLGSRAADRGTFYRRVVDAVRSAPSCILTTPTGDSYTHCLVVDTHGVSGVDAQLLHALSQHGWDIAVQFAPEVPGRDRALTSRTDRDLQWFVAQGWHLGAQVMPDVPTGERCLVPCASRTDEVRRAVALTKEAVASGIRLSSIGICVPGDQRYTERLLLACREAGVPVATQAEKSLAHTHAASLLHACCRVITGGWLRQDVERVLREPLLRDLVMNGPSLLLIAREERIVGGSGVQEWIERIDQRRSDMRAIADRGDDDWEHARRNEQRYAYALRTIQELRAILDIAVHGVMDAERFASILLTKIAPGIDLERRCADHAPHTLAAIRDTVSSYVALHRDHDVPSCSFATHVHRWWTIVRATMIATGQQARAGVRIMRPAELRGGALDLLIVVGCIEGEFPRSTVQQLDEDVVPDVQRHLAWESLADIAFAVAPGGTTVFSYPTTLDGAPVLVSTPLDAIREYFSPAVAWKSTKPGVTCIVHARDLNIDDDDRSAWGYSQIADLTVLADAEAQQLLSEDLNRPISPSRLDVATQCPYRFYAQSILRLDDLDIDDARLSPVERGTVLHEIVERWYKQLRGNVDVEISPAGLRAGRIDLSATSLESQWKSLRAVAEDVLSEQSYVHAFAPVERRALVGDDLRPGLLKRWLAMERADQATSGSMPVLFEQDIDIEIELHVDARIVRVPVKTRIDRIDIREIDGMFHVTVVDYKSSLSPTLSTTRVVEGKVSQMPIYLAAVRAWFATHGIAVIPEAAVYRAFGNSLHTPQSLDQRVVLADVGSPLASRVKSRTVSTKMILPDVLEEILTALYPSIVQIQSGMYPVRPLKDACDTCRVAQVCRKDHVGTIAVTIDEEPNNDEEA